MECMILERWIEQLSPQVEKCGYCRKRIAKETLYFRKTYTPDTPDPLGKNACVNCVEDADEKPMP
jgi:hypothetical protein